MQASGGLGFHKNLGGARGMYGGNVKGGLLLPGRGGKATLRCSQPILIIGYAIIGEGNIAAAILIRQIHFIHKIGIKMEGLGKKRYYCKGISSLQQGKNRWGAVSTE